MRPAALTLDHTLPLRARTTLLDTSGAAEALDRCRGRDHEGGNSHGVHGETADHRGDGGEHRESDEVLHCCRVLTSVRGAKSGMGYAWEGLYRGRRRRRDRSRDGLRAKNGPRLM